MSRCSPLEDLLELLLQDRLGLRVLMLDLPRLLLHRRVLNNDYLNLKEILSNMIKKVLRIPLIQTSIMIIGSILEHIGFDII